MGCAPSSYAHKDSTPRHGGGGGINTTLPPDVMFLSLSQPTVSDNITASDNIMVSKDDITSRGSTTNTLIDCNFEILMFADPIFGWCVEYPTSWVCNPKPLEKGFDVTIRCPSKRAEASVRISGCVCSASREE
eukprot:PhF_6_TR37167/c0_g6_i4/m.54723